MKLKSLLLPIALLLPLICRAQNSASIDDYNRAVSYMWNNVNNKRAFNLYIQPHWFPDSTGLWYVHHSKDNEKYMKITLPQLEKTELFDHQKLAELLSDSLRETVKANKLSLKSIQYKDTNHLSIKIKNKHYILNTTDYTLSFPQPQKQPKAKTISSPNDQWSAFSKDYNLYLKEKKTGKIKQLSTKGKKNYEYASWYGWADMIKGIDGERPQHFSVDWSENSEWLYANICDLRSAQKLFLLDWSQDTLYRPQLLSYYRGLPGDTGMVYYEPTFFNVKTGDEVKPDLPRSTHINSIAMRWSATPGKVYLKRQSRGFQNLYLYSFNLNNSQLDTLYHESSKTNIDNFEYKLAEKSHFLFFLSEKDGWRQLYALNLKSKKTQALTRGNYYINGIDRIDEKNQRIFFRASGKESDRNPYHQHLYSISFNGNNLRLITKEDLHHQVNISPDGRYFVDNSSTATSPSLCLLHEMKSGTPLSKLGEADISGMGDWTPPTTFFMPARDGKSTLYGAIWRPSNFDPNKKYPIIDHSYTGPHTQMFPKDFKRSISLSNQSIAELGFVVMMFDGLGSPGRSKEFHNYSYKNLGNNLKDHVAAIRFLGKHYNWIDTTRVGIYGHSAGGYDAGHALLAYPDFYKVAVASSGDHDHRMEKAWWPEMYMGWPVDSVYHLQSSITMAGNLKGRLLLTHGGIDENVNPSATFKLAEALIKADKPFDMMILPSQHHGYSGIHGKYFTKLRWNYFVEHLLGVTPLWDFKWQ